MKGDVGTTHVYSMSVAERLTGLTGRQIRYWEQYGLLTPGRTKGGQRIYSEADIFRLKEIKRLLANGMTLERVKAYYQSGENKRPRASDAILPRMGERIPSVTASLYGGNNRAEVERLIERKGT